MYVCTDVRAIASMTHFRVLVEPHELHYLPLVVHGAHFFSQSQIKDEGNRLGDYEQKILENMHKPDALPANSERVSDGRCTRKLSDLCIFSLRSNPTTRPPSSFASDTNKYLRCIFLSQNSPRASRLRHNLTEDYDDGRG